MKRRQFIAALGGMAVVDWPLRSWAEPLAGNFRVGYLGAGTASNLPDALDAFRDELHQRGYVEGKNLAIEYRWADDRDDRLAGLASDLVRSNVGVIVIEGHTPAIEAAKQATSTIPIVMAVSGDPVASGLVDSLARPGGNITGFALLTPELAPKRLEVLKEFVPALARVAVLWNAANPVKVLDWRATQSAAESLGLKLQSLPVQGADDFEKMFDLANRDRADALVVFPDGLINNHLKEIVDFALRCRFPTMCPSPEFVAAGGLLSYGPSYTHLFRRAADYVDKILRGTRPADLPVQQPTQFELVINMKTAKTLGVTISPTMLLRADKVIE